MAPAALAVGLFTIAASLALKRWLPRSPYMLLGLLAATALAFAIDRVSGGAQRVAVVGPIPAIWPRLSLPAFDLRLLPDLVGIAFALTIVALGQSISIAKAVAARSGQHIDANREFRGQGLSNIVGGLFSSYVSCGSLNRSFPNLDAGARTPLAAVFASLWLLLLAAVSAPLLALIPMAAIAALAAAHLVVALRRRRAGASCGASAARTSRSPPRPSLATVSIRLEVAILLGTILSLVTFLYRTSKPAIRIMGFDGTAPARPFVVRSDVPEPLPECPQVKMIRMEGEVYFGAVSHVSDLLRDLRAPANSPKHLLVMSKSMNFIDLAAADMWRAEMIDAPRRSAAISTSIVRARRCSSSGSGPASWPSSAPTTSSRPSGSRSRRSSTASTAASAPTARSASSRSARGCRCRSTARRARRRRARARAAGRPDGGSARTSPLLRVTAKAASGFIRVADTIEGDRHAPEDRSPLGNLDSHGGV